MDQTFNMCNISPQVGKGFNRDYWARFERFIKEVSRTAGEVFVVTGPLYLPTQDASGEWTMKHKLIGGWGLRCLVCVARYYGGSGYQGSDHKSYGYGVCDYGGSGYQGSDRGGCGYGVCDYGGADFGGSGLESAAYSVLVDRLL